MFKIAFYPQCQTMVPRPNQREVKRFCPFEVKRYYFISRDYGIIDIPWVFFPSVISCLSGKTHSSASWGVLRLYKAPKLHRARSAEQPPYWLEATLAIIWEIWAVAVWIDFGTFYLCISNLKAILHHPFKINQTAVSHIGVGARIQISGYPLRALLCLGSTVVRLISLPIPGRQITLGIKTSRLH